MSKATLLTLLLIFSCKEIINNINYISFFSLDKKNQYTYATSSKINYRASNAFTIKLKLELITN